MNLKETNFRKILYPILEQSVKYVFWGTILTSLFLIAKWQINISSGLTFLAYAFCLFSIGLLTGFIFGIPKYQYQKIKDSKGQELDTYYKENTNLEEISDWITKIVIGLTLVQFTQLLDWLDQAARTFSTGLEIYNEKVYGFCYASIVFYFLYGFLISYLWTKFEYILLLTSNRNEQRETQNNIKETARANKDLLLDKGIEDYEDQIKAGSQSFLTTVSEAERKSLYDKFLSSAIQKERSKLELDVHDTQKGRWGGYNKLDGFELKGTVKGKSKFKNFYDVEITVTKPLKDNNCNFVAFALHNTFVPRVVVRPFIGDKAVLVLRSYGAFTVGALLDNDLELEFDLMKAAGAESYKEFLEN